MSQPCPTCNALLDPHSAVCLSCGTPLPHSREDVTASSAGPPLRPLVPPLAVAAGGLLAYAFDSSLFLGIGALVGIVYSGLTLRRPH